MMVQVTAVICEQYYLLASADLSGLLGKPPSELQVNAFIHLWPRLVVSTSLT